MPSERSAATGRRAFDIPLYAAMFTLPWASDMENALGGIFSLVFNLSLLALIIFWIATSRERFSIMPRGFTGLVLFIGLHTVVTYGLLHPGELTLRATTIDLGWRLDERASTVVTIARGLLYILFAYALSTRIRRDAQVANMGAALGVSLLLLLFVGDVTASFAAGERFIGGYSNPNAFADVCLLSAFLNLYALLSSRLEPARKTVAGALLAVSLLAIMLSASRSAVLALAGGLLFLVLSQNRGQRWRTLALLGGLMLALVFLTRSSLFDLLLQRSNGGRPNARYFIWLEYLRQLPRYALGGVGLAREMSVLSSGIWHGRIWVPHNSYLSMLVAYGCVGLGLFLFYYFGQVRRLWRLVRARAEFSQAKVLLALSICYAISMMFGDRLWGRDTWVIFALFGSFLHRGGLLAGGEVTADA